MNQCCRVCYLYFSSCYVCVSKLSVFFLYDAAPTEIYTYWHTRSLHDALPILQLYLSSLSALGKKRIQIRLIRFYRLWTILRCLNRSEENTSELQSSRRISYAVFCLKKKKTNVKIRHTARK